MYGKHAKLKLALLATLKSKRKHSPDRHRSQSHQANGYELLVEATGSPTGLALAQHMTKPRGTLVLKSTFHGAAPVETWPIVVKEITVIGSRCGPFDKALALLRSGQVDADAVDHAHIPALRSATGDRVRTTPRCHEGVA